MNSRERTVMALAHEEPDRPPISATYTPEASALLRSAVGREEDDLGYVMGNDLIKTTVGVENSYYMYDTPTYVCPFGITWRNVSNATGAYTEIVDGALRNDPDGEKLRPTRMIPRCTLMCEIPLKNTGKRSSSSAPASAPFLRSPGICTAWRIC